MGGKNTAQWEFFAAQWKNNLWHWAAVAQQTNYHKNNFVFASRDSEL
jgi:IS1 family transposase